MPNDSTTGGPLLPNVPEPLEDADLVAIFQQLVAGLTGIDGTLIRPRWQAVPPQQPDANTNWCALGVATETADDNPSIVHDGNSGSGPTQGVDIYVRHEEIEVYTTFYGPGAQAAGKRLRDGIAMPQNSEALHPSDIRWVSCGPLRAVPEVVNQQWIRRYDMLLLFRRKVTRTYGVRNIASSDSTITDDYGVVTPIPVSGP
jgi:hypothetical protein